MSVYKRLMFVNEAFCKIDRNNGGFLPGCRTSDNIFILQGLIQRQMILGNSLYVCFVDFSKAFDLVSRHILFYKIYKSGWQGRVIDTIRSLYSKTRFRVKDHGYVSTPIFDHLGVNQGGVASGLLFRKCMADLGYYLNSKFGICVNSTIIAYLLWADDLILFSDTPAGLQKQLDGLFTFCSTNHMIVNALKTKVMEFGKPTAFEIKFNKCAIQRVSEYKYLGTIISSVSRNTQDRFTNNYKYLCDQARKAEFILYKK